MPRPIRVVSPGTRARYFTDLARALTHAHMLAANPHVEGVAVEVRQDDGMWKVLADERRDKWLGRKSRRPSVEALVLVRALESGRMVDMEAVLARLRVPPLKDDGGELGPEDT